MNQLAQIYNPAIEQVVGGSKNADGGVALATLIARLYRISVIIGGIALLLYLAWGGLNWITAGSDEQKAKDARSRITNAIVGMAVLVGTVAVAILLSTVFGFDLLNPSFDFGD